jgi:hypothetical protein
MSCSAIAPSRCFETRRMKNLRFCAAIEILDLLLVAENIDMLFTEQSNMPQHCVY